MASIRQISLFLVVSMVISCTDRHQMIENGLASFSDLQCQAAKLNEQRFALFDQIRSLEADSLANQQAIDSLKNVGEQIKQQSLIKADSLRAKLSNFLASQDFSDDERKYIDLKINALVEKWKRE